MDLYEIEESFLQERKRYRKMYYDALQQMLIDIGMWDTDVIYKEQRGRLVISEEGFSFIHYNVEFAPYNKDGQLSKRRKNLFIWKVTKEKYADEIKKIVQIA